MLKHLVVLYITYMKNVKIKGITLLISAMLFSLSISSQVSRKQVTKTTTTQRQSLNDPPVVSSLSSFWYEDFGTSQKGDIGNLAKNTETKNGVWTYTKFGEQGQKSNQWYISSSSAFTGLNSCSEGYLKNNTLNDRTLHVAFDYRDNVHNLDLEAIYAKNESSYTDSRIETPTIDFSGRTNVTLNFDYFTGGIVGQDYFSLYCFDGSEWILLSNFGPSYVNPACDSVDRATWKSSDTYVLPLTTNNNPEVKLGFRWKNEASTGGNSEIYSVSIDNIKLTDNASVPTPTDPSVLSLKQKSSKSTTTVETVVERKIEFTVYPNPNSGQFTIDFAGIENNHEVQILLSDLSTGREIYSTSFYSRSIDHNKIDVNPTEKVNPGRYACSLICEGIKVTKQVLIN